ncbi:unnamed protein product [Ectocarpus sp. CCAP 1310/34]|nr:unnamed protein product [Ectocarpus sp. CCAP 1310/34]
MHGAALALSGTNPPFVGSAVFEAFQTSQTSDTGSSSGSGSSSSAAFLDLHGATTPLSELPAGSEHLGPHDGVLPSPTLAGRKRSQPTGGWSSSNDGNDQERATAGAASSSMCMRRNQNDHSEARPSRFIMQGAAAADAAAGVVGVKGEVGDGFLAAGGGSSGTTSSGASRAEEMELDVGDTPVAYLRAATSQQLRDDATRSTSSEVPAATFVAEPSTSGPAVVVPAATTETTPAAAAATAAAAAAAAAAVFVPGVAATADADNGSAADPVSCLGDYNFSFE